MNILSGKLSKTKGHIYINGVEESPTIYKKIVGYVPQVKIKHILF